MEYLFDKKANVSKSMLLVPLMFFLMPSLPIPGSQYITYPLIFAVIILCFLISKNLNRLEFDSNLLIIFGFLLSFSIIMAVSSLLNYENVTVDSLPQIFKPVFFGAILLFGYFVSLPKTRETVVKTLLRLSYILLTAQIIVGASQLFGMDTFSFLYDDEKTRPLGSAVRIVGTTINPNIFAWLVIQMSVIIVLFEDKTLKKTFFLFAAAALVVFSGSRTFLILYPIILVFAQMTAYKRGAVFYLFKLPLYGLFIYAIYEFIMWGIYQMRFSLPYLYQLTSVLETGDLSSVSSFYARTVMWENGINQMGDRWLFGIGPGSLTVLDNEYLYILINYGIIYLILHLLMYLAIMFLFLRTGDRKIAVLGIQYIIFSFVVGFQADTLVGWNYPVFIMFLTGVAISLVRRNKYIQTSQ